MDQVHVIRHQVLVEGRSQRSVARDHGVSRNTVRKYLEQSEPRRVESKPRRRWVTERMAPRLEELLRRWSRRTTAKQRLTATRLHRQLLEDGYEVGITTVRSYVREWKRQRRETFIPLVHRAGECGQVDFFEVTVEEDGVAHRVWKFLLHLPYSGRSFVWLYDRCDQVAFLDGHVRAFAHFGGVPCRLVYDNLSSAVRRRVGAERELTDRFQALVSHYLFEPCFARPGEGHDKGSVESRGKGIRLAHMSPVPQGATLEQIAGEVLASVDAAHGELARWEEEQEALRELPAAGFEPRKLEIVQVSRQATVQLGGATYSVPSRWKSLKVHALVGAGDIAFTCRDEEYRCKRMRPGQRLVRYSHYFEELSRKPQAVRQVAPELLAELGPSYRKLWTMLELRHGALETARLFAKLLSVVTDEGSEEVASALEEALAAGRFDLLGFGRAASRSRDRGAGNAAEPPGRERPRRRLRRAACGGGIVSRAARRAVIAEGLKTLKMPSVLRDYEQVARQAQDAQWDYEDYLWQLLEAEIRDREARTVARRLRAARFPDHKTLEQIDFEALQGVSKPRLRELACCDYIDRGDDVVLVGPIGTGKTHLAIALGIEAAQRRYRVWFRKASDLVRDLIEARDRRELGRLQQRLQRVDLLICDELGFVPFDRAGGELLFNVFADRYERRSTIVTSNLAFSEWVKGLRRRKAHHGAARPPVTPCPHPHHQGILLSDPTADQDVLNSDQTLRHSGPKPPPTRTPRRCRLRKLPVVRKTADRFPHHLGKPPSRFPTATPAATATDD